MQELVPSNTTDLPEEPVPANLNWNQWMGPLNDPNIHYHPDLVLQSHLILFKMRIMGSMEMVS